MLIFKKICLAMLVLSLITAAYVIQAGIALVEVNTEEVHLYLPIPIALGHLAGELVNLSIDRSPQWKKMMQYRAEIAVLLNQLQSLPDTDLVEVKNREEHILITKREDALHISIRSPKEKVLVRIPMAMMEKLAHTFQSPQISVGDLVACLEWQKSGDLVRVENEKEQIRISLL